MKKLTEKELLLFLENTDYELVSFGGSARVNSKFRCKIHNHEWEVKPTVLMANNTRGNCPVCNGRKMTLDLAKEILKDRPIEVIEIVSGNNPSTWKCKIDGHVWKTAHYHVLREFSGCPKCARKNITTEEFINEANLIHNFKYDYSLVEYKTAKNKVKIVCPDHGEFLQDPDHHIGRKQGCPLCEISKGELLIYNWLKENKIRFKHQFELITPEIARNTNLMIIDFFVVHNNNQYFIEYDGEQHFKYKEYFHKNLEGFENELRRDRVLNEFCELHKDKVTLIRFKFDQENETIIKLLENEFKNK